MKFGLRIVLIFLFLVILALAVSYLIFGGTTEIVSRVTIQRSPEQVFAYISDMRNEVKWNPDVQYMEKISDGPVRVGTRFRAKWHMSDTVNVIITDLQPPYHATFENGGPVEVKLDVFLRPGGSGTNFESHFIATPHGFVRAIFPIFKSRIKSQEQENMVNLKKALEQ